MKVMVIPIVTGSLGTITERLVQRLEDLEKEGRWGDHPNYNIVKFGQNSEKRSGDLRRFSVSQTPVRNQWLTLV